jgi:hypothetical protein
MVCHKCKRSVAVDRENSEPDDQGIYIVTVKCAECNETLQVYSPDALKPGDPRWVR